MKDFALACESRSRREERERREKREREERERREKREREEREEIIPSVRRVGKKTRNFCGKYKFSP